jgi:predicted HTH domain antitoxin
MTISVRYEPKEDVDFLSKVLKKKKSEALRDLLDTGRKMKAVELYKEGKASLGLAARVAKMSLSEFMDLLEEYNIPLNVGVVEARKALEHARKEL